MKPPAGIRVRGVPVAECGGVIWACFADDPPALPSFADTEPVRSLYLDLPLSEALAPLGRAIPAAGAADAYRVEVEGDDWLVAGQRIDDSHSALHIVAFGGSASVRRAANWAVSLRRERELELA